MLKIHHLRNATLVIEIDTYILLIDPMLGKKGSTLPFSFIRFKPRKNPIVSLPENSNKILDKVTHCLITHLHPDHIDKTGIQFLKDKNIPVICSIKDETELQKKGVNIYLSIDYWKETIFLNGTIEGIPAKHGYGFVSKLMGNVMGFYIQLPHQKSIYVSGDTIYTDAVDKVLKEYEPQVSIVACGTAQLDLFQPLLMRVPDILKFVKNAPKTVVANHLGALNHCPTKRSELKEKLIMEELFHKVFIPNDGDVIEIK